jgi:hypothetical protein
MTNISSHFDILHKAVHKALNRVMTSSDQETDPDLITYNSLKPEHFDAMRKKYGDEHTFRYIKTMEAKRIRGKNG